MVVKIVNLSEDFLNLRFIYNDKLFAKWQFF